MNFKSLTVSKQILGGVAAISAVVLVSACRSSQNSDGLPVPNGQPRTTSDAAPAPVPAPAPQQVAITPASGASNEGHQAAASSEETITRKIVKTRHHANASHGRARRAASVGAAQPAPVIEPLSPYEAPIAAAAPEPAVKQDSFDPSEPTTMIPSHVGATGLSGEDRSTAMMGHRGTFNPAALEARTRDERLRPATEIDLGRYGYDRKKSFTAVMKNRLEALDRKLDSAKGRVQEATQPTQGQYRDLLGAVERERLDAQAKLKQVDSVSPMRWDGYKIEFRDSVAELERSFQRLDAALR